ncbi:TetR/AcrR family transcriptional regulator [Parasphingorhabdus sp.]|uniref:TetR/AcrR family transcriptional regulator n=1 Tax=Parasphingorhabdus sp. TaxID=2709688 RepID=UPI003A8E9326
MTGLREKSKLRRQKLITSAAEKLFHAQGYSGTTIEQIASTAEVSIGSIYSFFGSKGGIMRALMQPVIERMKTNGEAVLQNPAKRGADAVIELFEAHRFTNDWKDLNILKALDPRASSTDESLKQLTVDFAEFIQDQLTQLLTQLQEDGRLNETVVIADAVFILYTLLVAHFEVYLHGDGLEDYDDVLVELHRRIRLIFISWV